MPTKSETVLLALETLLKTTDATVVRNDPIPPEIPADGLIILRDGDPGEPLVTMSPLLYEYQHRAVIEVFIQKRTERDAVLDTLKAQIGPLLTADRTLGGLCDWIEAGAPEVTDMAVEGGASIKAAEIAVTLIYVTTDPLA